MSIKFAEQDRVAQYGIALGILLYTVWRGLVRLLARGDLGSSRCEYSTTSEWKA